MGEGSERGVCACLRGLRPRAGVAGRRGPGLGSPEQPASPGAWHFTCGGGLCCQRSPRPLSFPFHPSEVGVGAAARDPGPESFPLTMNFSISDSD